MAKTELHSVKGFGAREVAHQQVVFDGTNHMVLKTILIDVREFVRQTIDENIGWKGHIVTCEVFEYLEGQFRVFNHGI